jgi:hypothetical protein
MATPATLQALPVFESSKTKGNLHIVDMGSPFATGCSTLLSGTDAAKFMIVMVKTLITVHVTLPVKIGDGKCKFRKALLKADGSEIRTMKATNNTGKILTASMYDPTKAVLFVNSHSNSNKSIDKKSVMDPMLSKMSVGHGKSRSIITIMI